MKQILRDIKIMNAENIDRNINLPGLLIGRTDYNNCFFGYKPYIANYKIIIRYYFKSSCQDICLGLLFLDTASNFRSYLMTQLNLIIVKYDGPVPPGGNHGPVSLHPVRHPPYYLPYR